jgi:hypothetical protein
MFYDSSTTLRCVIPSLETSQMSYFSLLTGSGLCASLQSVRCKAAKRDLLDSVGENGNENFVQTEPSIKIIHNLGKTLRTRF